jgi:hypothetical protein
MWSNGYSTPIIYRPPRGPAQIIAPGSYQLTAYSIVDGQPLWYVRGLTSQPKSAPTIAGDVVYFSGWTVGNDAGQQVELPVFRRGGLPRAMRTRTGSYRKPNFRSPGSPQVRGEPSTWIVMGF